MRATGPQLAAFDALPVGVAVTSPTGELVFANQAFAALAGRPAHVLIGRSIGSLVSDADGRPWRLRTGRGAPDEQLEGRLHHAPGGTMVVDLRCSSVELDGDPLRVIVISDATRRHRAETATRQRAHVWRTLIDQVSLAIVGLDASGHVTLANPYLCRLVGMAEADVLGADWFTTFLVPDDVEHVRHVFDAVRSSGSWPKERARLRAGDGRIREIEWFNVRMREAEGDTAVTLSVGADVTGQVRSARVVRATSEVLGTVLAAAHIAEALRQATVAARQLAAADAAALLMSPTVGADPMLVARDDGTDAVAEWRTIGRRDINALTVRGVHVVDPTIWPQVVARWPGRRTGGPTLAVPLGVDRLLLLARSDPGAVFAEEDVAAVAAFAGSVAPALSTAQAHEERQRLAVIADRERIARDLHDTVIQRLFALGMSLLARMGEHAWQSTAHDAIDHAVSEMDDIITTIRSTVFQLEQPTAPDVRARLAEVVDHMTLPLERPPELTVRGPIDTVVPSEVADHMLAVLQEALANVAKHADASRVTVHIVADETLLELRVADDGKGLVDSSPPAGTAGFGLQHMAERAAGLGGALDLEQSRLGGLELVWSVPLDGEASAQSG